jgi:hypothetical protein
MMYALTFILIRLTVNVLALCSACKTTLSIKRHRRCTLAAANRPLQILLRFGEQARHRRRARGTNTPLPLLKLGTEAWDKKDVPVREWCKKIPRRTLIYILTTFNGQQSFCKIKVYI